MKKAIIIACLACALALPGVASAQFQSTGDPDLDQRLHELLQASFLKFNCEIPGFQPRVCVLKRGSSPNPDQITKVFIGDENNIIGRVAMTSPLWGKGTRIKAGTVVYATPDGYKPQPSASGGAKIELVPAFLDMFQTGFGYMNNIPHKPVYATNVKYDQTQPAKVSYFKVFPEKEGKTAAKALISKMVGELKLPAGFQLYEHDLIQTEDERLYVYKAYPEYITSFTGKDKDGKPLPTSQPVAVPVLDDLVEVRLDGDKLLCSMNYFWDNSLAASGSPQESIQAGVAVVNARDWLMKRYKDNPPAMSVDGIRMGFIQDRSNRMNLIPVWLFDCGYTERVREELEGNRGASESIMRRAVPFAVNALTGECIAL